MKNPPPRLSLSGDEFTKLVVYQTRKQRLERALRIKSVCEELVLKDGDPRQAIARRILQLLSNALWLLERGRNADMSDIERLCNRADIAYLAPIAARAPRGRGRKRGAVDALGRMIVEFLRSSSSTTGKDVLRHLQTNPRPVVRVERDRKKDDVVVWRTNAGRLQRTSWRSIRDSRLPGYRALVRQRNPPGP